MSGNDFSTLALGWIALYGAPVVGVILFLGGLGVPLPVTLIVIASGAFIRQNLLDAYFTPVLGLVATVLGDVTLYGLGYFASGWIEPRFGKAPSWINARSTFDQHGGAAIFLTRWLLTAAAVPTTLIAGSSNYRFRNFCVYDSLGELIWVALYGGLGYAFGSQWELISDFISNFSGFILGALALAAGVYLLFRMGKKSPPVEAGMKTDKR